jgi:C4-dicarboxylate transporter DctM subunit
MLLPILLVLLFALMGMPLFACLAALGLFGLHHVDTPGSGGITDVYGDLTGEKAVSLSTIPLFTFAGYLMASARTAQRLVRLGSAVLGWIPGGLAVLTLLICAFFTTFTGASGVTIVAIGGLMLPAMQKAGYPRAFSLGSVTAFGAVGLLFPPALPLIVYGIIFGINSSLADASAAQPFDIEKFYLYAGLGPGAVLVTVLLCYCVWQGVRSRAPRGPFSLWRAMIFPLLPLLPVGVVWGLVVDREFRGAFVDALWELVIPLTVLVPFSQGWQPPEAAALCAFYVFVIEVFVYRDIRLGRDLFRITRESMTLVGAIFMKIVGATLLKNYLVSANIPTELFEWMKQYVHTPAGFLLVLNGVLLLVGGMMDIFSAIIVVVPLIVPAAQQFGIDPYHLGVIFLLNLEIGYLLPPAGLNIFIAAFRFNRPITEIYRAVLPFIALMLVALGIVTYVPSLTRVPGHVAAAPRPPAAALPLPPDPLADDLLPDGGVAPADGASRP